MNTNAISLESNTIIPKLSDTSIKSTINSTKKLYNHNTKLNKKLTKISKKIRPESAVFTLIKLLVENHKQIQLINSVLYINAENNDLVEKLNYCLEFLAHIPFSYQYDHVQKKILLDFFHLEEEMSLINNLEIEHTY